MKKLRVADFSMSDSLMLPAGRVCLEISMMNQIISEVNEWAC